MRREPLANRAIGKGARTGVAVAVGLLAIVLFYLGSPGMEAPSQGRPARSEDHEAADPRREDSPSPDSLAHERERIKPARPRGAPIAEPVDSPRSASTRFEGDAASLHGRVLERDTGRPAVYVPILVEAQRPYRTITDEYGRYSVDELPAGAEVTVSALASESNRASARITLVAPVAYQQDLWIAPRSAYSGWIVEQGTGLPIVGAVVSIGSAATSELFEDQTDSTGAFAIFLDDPTYRECREWIVRAEYHCPRRLDPRSITLPATIEMLPAARIEGIVVKDAGTPLQAFVRSESRRLVGEPGADALAYLDTTVDPATPYYGYDQWSGADGRFVLANVAPYSRHRLRAVAAEGSWEGEAECVTGAPGSTAFARIVLSTRECELRVRVQATEGGRRVNVDGAKVIVSQFDPSIVGATQRIQETIGFESEMTIAGLMPGLASVRVEWAGRNSPPLQRVMLEAGEVPELEFVFDGRRTDSGDCGGVQVIDAATGEPVRECSVEWRLLGTSTWGAGTLATSERSFDWDVRPGREARESDEPRFDIDPPAGRIVVVARANDGTRREGSRVVDIDPQPEFSMRSEVPRPDPIVVRIHAPALGVLRLEDDAALDGGGSSRSLFVRRGSDDAWFDQLDLSPRAVTDSFSEYIVPVGDYTLLSGRSEVGVPDREVGRVVVGSNDVATVRVPPGLRR